MFNKSFYFWIIVWKNYGEVKLILYFTVELNSLFQKNQSMEALDIKGTNDTPKVILDIENDIFEISGRSLPEDVVSFYKPVIDWLDEYKVSPLEYTEFVFRYIYFNTATSKLIQDILFKLEEIYDAGHNVQIMWFYEEDDEDMQDVGEEFMDLCNVPFELIGY